MAHFLVTGGAGFIGSHLAEELVQARPSRPRCRRARHRQARQSGSLQRRRVSRGRSRRSGVRAPGRRRHRVRAASGGDSLGADVGRRSAHLAPRECRRHAERPPRRAGRAASAASSSPARLRRTATRATLPKHEAMPPIRSRRTPCRRSWASNTCGCSPGSTAWRPSDPLLQRVRPAAGSLLAVLRRHLGVCDGAARGPRGRPSTATASRRATSRTSPTSSTACCARATRRARAGRSSTSPPAAGSP